MNDRLKKLAGINESSYGEEISKSASKKNIHEPGSPEWFRTWFSLPYMTGVSRQLKENEQDHSDTLKQTGFWGEQGAGCIFISTETGKILLNHRSRHVEQPGTWGSWGGAMDDNESPKQAAKREANEESGEQISDDQIIPIYVFKDSRSGFQYHNYIVVVDEEFSPKIPQDHAWETQGWGWFGANEMPSPLHFGIQGILSDAKSVEIIKKLMP